MLVIFENTFTWENMLLYECKVLWNRIVNGIDILILKDFNIVYVKSMVGKWCDILIIHKQYKNEKIFMQTKT
jgi:hypothetical protein